ncbi:MAG: CidA/LrgA family protein [Cetobacterium sp.]|uniref:CidA/LrgA family protein n=1 Tax=Cetobacterium sp. TaxID=2071632 RepID=UPI002FCC05C2
MIGEFAIILAITYISSIISKYTPIPIPGPVIGILLLFILLNFKILKVENIKNATNLMLTNLAFLFLPPGVGLLKSIDILANNWHKLFFVIVTTTIITLVITGWSVQFIIKRKEEENKDEFTC